ncbi:PREDICTED: uncharacterized protein LOC109350599 [Lupinus angustifolius]|uniref:uncharacterized protein LOC109350599 n=1 Tax=Lupinus angustifolius TaxID=3871 RepID=UPI00092E29AF|nr:PREDICTED: uncharacterized protein LOC109350599 [Lupinus angustifolius]
MLPNLWGLCSHDHSPTVLHNSSQHMNISVSIADKSCYISAVYAHTNYVQGRNLWYDLNAQIIANDGPWTCIGDFNVVLGANEARGPRVPHALPSTEFKTFTDCSKLIHLATRGSLFTWSNRRSGVALTEKRLDKSLCFTKCGPSMRIVKVVENIWNRPCYGCPMYILTQKLKNRKKELKLWNKNVFGNIHLNVKTAMAELELIQNSKTIMPSQDWRDQENLAQNKLMIALDVEESFWK